MVYEAKGVHSIRWCWVSWKDVQKTVHMYIVISCVCCVCVCVCVWERERERESVQGRDKLKSGDQSWESSYVTLIVPFMYQGPSVRDLTVQFRHTNKA